MYWVKQIQQLLNVDEGLARQVMDYMSLDFSEASQEEFERSAWITFDILRDKLVE
jgi:hypothetical protein